MHVHVHAPATTHTTPIITHRTTKYTRTTRSHTHTHTHTYTYKHAHVHAHIAALMRSPSSPPPPAPTGEQGTASSVPGATTRDVCQPCPKDRFAGKLSSTTCEASTGGRGEAFAESAVQRGPGRPSGSVGAAAMPWRFRRCPCRELPGGRLRPRASAQGLRRARLAERSLPHPHTRLPQFCEPHYTTNGVEKSLACVPCEPGKPHLLAAPRVRPAPKRSPRDSRQAKGLCSGRPQPTLPTPQLPHPPKGYVRFSGAGCKPCPAGTSYSNTQGAIQCILCTPGFVSAAPASSQCLPCNPGT
jgi:hypothetical protein